MLFKNQVSLNHKKIIELGLKLFKGNLQHSDIMYSFAPPGKLSNKILIGTHHKTGSVWLHSIFRNICRIHSLNYFSGLHAELPNNFDVFFQNHSYFDFNSLKEPFRGIHIIRDPRDVIISGCFYHQKSKEKWLHQSKDDPQGHSYQQKINLYNNIDDQILFEMENVGRETINDMLNWDYNHPSFLEIKYEDLIVDTNLILFHNIFSFLNFPGQILPYLLLIAHTNSIFSGKISKSVHIRSGKTRQWKKYFKAKHKDRFIELFGDGLIRLGYEKDNDWETVQ